LHVDILASKKQKGSVLSAWGNTEKKNAFSKDMAFISQIPYSSLLDSLKASACLQKDE